jgi:alpha-1,2-mannosyltransferase
VSTRRTIVWLVALLVVLTGVGVLASRATKIDDGRPFDFDLNWVAAQRLLDREPLYDRHDSRIDAIAQFGSLMRLSNRGPYTSYIGTPAVALVHAPFTWLDHDDAVDTFRALTLLGMLGAVAISTLALPRRARGPVGVAVAGALLMSWPLTSTLWIGQANELVMVCLAVAAAAAARERWPLVGVALGCAAILKLTPVLIVLYLVVRGRKQVIGYALAAAVAVSGLAAAVGRPFDAWVWVRDVLPNASGGSLYVGNQSIVGWLARITSPITSLDHQWPVGGERYVSWMLIAGFGALLLRLRRGRPVVPIEIGAAVLVVLVAGPLSWDHYFVWAFVPLVLVLDPRAWVGPSRRERGLWATGVVTTVALLTVRLPVPSPAAVRADGLVRWYGSPYTIAALVLLVVVLRQLSDRADEPRPVPRPNEHSFGRTLEPVR